ncbi:MAG: hypothetical protein JNL74_19860 [Fibrobacteres bacterium]|nr:hypothetical protein [Fibrobacterota bacterium]
MRKTLLLIMSIVSVAFLFNCGLDVREPDYLDLMDVNPKDNSQGNDPWGPYLFIFDQPVSIASDSMLYASFPAYWETSGETLFVHRVNGLAGYNSRCTLTVSAMMRNDGETETVSYTADFLTGCGEAEDNGSFRYADTLKESMLYGELDNSSARSDEDYFVLSSDSTETVAATLKLLNDKPFYFSCSYSSKVYKISKSIFLEVVLKPSSDSLFVVRNFGSERDSVKIQGKEIVCRLGTEDPVNLDVKLPPGSRYVFTRK